MNHVKQKSRGDPVHISEPLKEYLQELHNQNKEINSMVSTKENTITESPYMSPKELAERWRCARSSVDRIARRNNFTRLCIGDGQNGAVRYLREEVKAYEEKMLVQMN